MRDYYETAHPALFELIERMSKETGGFGGLMITAHDWAAPDKMRRSVELFARFVMPHFRGHTAALQDEWRAFQQQVGDGGVKLPAGDAPSNLVNV